MTPDLLVTNKSRNSRFPKSPVLANPLSVLTLSAKPQSRLQITDMIANQTEATYKFNDGVGSKHTEVDRETWSIDKYVGLSSEALPGGFNGGGSLMGVSMFAPQYALLRFGPTELAGLPTRIGIDTGSG